MAGQQGRGHIPVTHHAHGDDEEVDQNLDEGGSAGHTHYEPSARDENRGTYQAQVACIRGTRPGA